MDYQTDVVIVGAGVVGSSIARELSRYKLDVMLVEKQQDIGGYASKSNGATLAGNAISNVLMYDLVDKIPKDILMVIKASRVLYPRLLDELNVKHKRFGCITVAQNEEEEKLMDECLRKARETGDYGTYKISTETMLKMEPSLNPELKAGYYCPDDISVDVFELVAALVNNAVANGVRLLTGVKALSVDVDEENKCVRGLVTDAGYIKARYVVNAAAIYADELAKTTGYCNFRNYPRYGQTFMMDKNLPYAPKHHIRPCPSVLTVGRLIQLTTSGNFSVGPSADNGEIKDNNATTAEVMESVLADCRKMIPAINPRDSVTQFTGIRPAKDPANWVLESGRNIKGYAEAIGIDQGVVACAAIGPKMAFELEKDGLELVYDDTFDPCRVKPKRFVDMTDEEREEAIRKDPRYGNVICRCETITEAEIVRAIHTVPKAKTVDAIKRRLRAGMGRCQGGFCSPRVVEILARELNVPVETICKNEPGSEIVTGHNR